MKRMTLLLNGLVAFWLIFVTISRYGIGGVVGMAAAFFLGMGTAFTLMRKSKPEKINHDPF